MTSGPPFQQQQQAYAQSVGITPTSKNVIFQRNPTANDTNYPIGQFWQNTTLGNLFYLNSFTSTGGVLQAEWITISTSGTPIDSIGMQTGTSPVVADANGLITFNGATVAAGSNPVRTDGTGANTMALEVQLSQAIAATDATAVGLSAFDSSQFNVDANGFVTLSGEGQAIDSIAVQTGTSPIVPTAAGLVTINGAVVAAGTNPIRTEGTDANTLAVEVQISQAIAATDATKIGLSNFNSSHFSVDANGFVSLIGGGEAIDSIGVDAATAPGTNPVAPTVAGLVTITGGQVAAGTTANVIRTDSLAASTFTIEIQRSQAVSSSTIGDNGVSHFNSANFSVDANGFVSALSQAFAYTNVTNAMSPYTVLSTDYYISVDCSGGAVTLNFPNSPTALQLWIVKDRTGSAATNNITLTTPGGMVNIDGTPSFVMNTAYEAVNLLANSAPSYEVF